MTTASTPKVTRIRVLDNADAVHIGHGLFGDYLVQDLLQHTSASNFIIVTDTHLASLYLEPLQAAFCAHLSTDQRLLCRLVPPGERTKSREYKAALEDFLLSQGCTRDTCLIALGGGVVGDLVGYVAATFMRGVPVVQIPTTLLAMVDSSVGGKTAIDTEHGKNLIGAFWQPHRIYMDLDLLRTLPRREFSNGMAEVIKTAAISSLADFEVLEQGADPIWAALKHGMRTADQDNDILLQVILASVRFKAKVVSADDREAGLRGLLNFGHSIGHGVEALLAPRWLHGECVAVGMVMETELAVSLGHCDATCVARLKRCLEIYGLPTQLGKESLNADDVMNVMRLDKKNAGKTKRVTLLSCLGKTFEQGPTCVADPAIQRVLEKHCTGTSLSSLMVSDKKGTSRFQRIREMWSTIWICSTPDTQDQVSTRLGPSLAVALSFAATRSEQGGWIIKDVCQGQRGSITVVVTSRAGSSQERVSSDKDEALYEISIRPDEDAPTERILSFLSRLASNHRHIATSAQEVQRQTRFVTLSGIDLIQAPKTWIDQLVEDADAVEFRADLFSDLSLANVGAQLAALQTKTTLPIIFTVRTRPQAGQFDPNALEDYIDLVTCAYRWGCEYVDLEFTFLGTRHLERIAAIHRCYSALVPTQAILSFHDVEHQAPWSSKAMENIYEQAHSLQQPGWFPHSCIKLVSVATTDMDNMDLERFRHKHGHKSPMIAINMGDLGRLSRVLNQHLTPATHVLLPYAAAPGQLSIDQLKQMRRQLCLE